MRSKVNLFGMNATILNTQVRLRASHQCGKVLWFALGVLLSLSLLLHSANAETRVRDTMAADKPTPTDVLLNIFTGLAQGDFSKYSRDFSPEMNASQTREAFLILQKKIQSKLGKLKSLEHLGAYTQGGNVINLFKAKFTKDKDDVLIKLVLDAKRSIPMVTGLWLDSPALER